ncbi:hypothetical protein E4K72_01820 [Oxalobacteraceae bacterium OM1]|nr:hypothetical protein E4K72_01820 [Oxalobacteraceae bacterium OM1]
MATTIVHRRVRIVTLEADEIVGEHCVAGDIALVPDGGKWWTQFVAEDGSVEGYDEPYDDHNHALWAAKAAAEMGF